MPHEDDPNEYCDINECFGPGSHDGSDGNCVGKWCEGDEADKQRCKDNPKPKDAMNGEIDLNVRTIQNRESNPVETR